MEILLVVVAVLAAGAAVVAVTTAHRARGLRTENGPVGAERPGRASMSPLTGTGSDVKPGGSAGALPLEDPALANGLLAEGPDASAGPSTRSPLASDWPLRATLLAVPAGFPSAPAPLSGLREARPGPSAPTAPFWVRKPRARCVVVTATTAAPAASTAITTSRISMSGSPRSRVSPRGVQSLLDLDREPVLRTPESCVPRYSRGSRRPRHVRLGRASSLLPARPLVGPCVSWFYP